MAGLYNSALAERICALLADGKSVLQVSKLDGMPAEATIRHWVLEDREGFASKFSEARKYGFLHMADEIIEIADGPELAEEDSKARATRDRLKVDTRKWMLAHMLPKVFGDKLQVSGDPDGAPLKVEHISMTEIARRLAFLLSHPKVDG